MGTRTIGEESTAKFSGPGGQERLVMQRPIKSRILRRSGSHGTRHAHEARTSRMKDTINMIWSILSCLVVTLNLLVIRKAKI